MKLNFATLATQLKNTPAQNQQADISSQLNYYRRPTGQNEANKNVKPRKSQLQKQEESSTILIGSSILTDYFSIPQRREKQQKFSTQRINLSVMYPYEVSTSIDPNNVDDHIEEMKSKGILDQSAMKFIKRQIAKDLSKSKQKDKKQSLKILNSLDQSIYLQGQSIKTQVSNANEDFLNETQQTFKTDNSLNIDPSTKHLLFKNFLKETLPFQQKKNSLLTSTTIQSQQKQKKKSVFQKKLPSYMKPIHQKQKITNKKLTKQLVSTQQIKLQQQLQQVKTKPSLQLTKSSPFTYKIQAQRESKYRHKNTNVFNELYNDSYIRECMKSLQRDSIQKDIDERHNFTKTLRTEQSRKYQVNESFMERLQKSIQKKYYKDYLINKYSVNEKTGQPFFKPDMTLSKHTYEKLFHKSLQKFRSQSVQSLRNQQLEKPKVKRSKQQIPYKKDQSLKQISVSYKSAARTKQNSIQKLSCSVDKDQKSIKIDKKSMQIVEKMNQKIIDRLVIMFYPSQGQGKQQDFQRTYENISSLSQQQYAILSPLFSQIEKLQQSTKVSALMFKSLVQQLFNRLNYYDQLALRQGVMKKKEKLITENSYDKNQIQKKDMRKQKKTHHPKINELSSSMQKLNPKYDQALYYV